MAAVELLERPRAELSRPPSLRLVVSPPTIPAIRRGPSVSQRRAFRARATQRRHRTLALAALVAALTVLAVPGHVFGATTGAGLAGDLASSSVLASGMDYVVQPGDTVASIARLVNPLDPHVARALLVRELGASVVVPGEHVLIP